MAEDSPDDYRTRPRIRKVDWQEVIRILDELPAGTDVLVGVMDQSVRSQILMGRYKYIDPSKYIIWTEKCSDSRTQVNLYMKRKT